MVCCSKMQSLIRLLLLYFKISDNPFLHFLQSGNIQVWTKPLTGDSMAFAYINFGTGGMPSKVSMALKDMGLTKPTGYNISEAFNNKLFGTFHPPDTFSAQVNPTGIFLGWAKPL